MSPGDIEAIEVNKRTVEDRHTEMLTKWIQSSPNPQISQLVEVLESDVMGRVDLAKKVAALELT